VSLAELAGELLGNCAVKRRQRRCIGVGRSFKNQFHLLSGQAAFNRN
jgi:hypothetical protein